MIPIYKCPKCGKPTKEEKPRLSGEITLYSDSPVLSPVSMTGFRESVKINKCKECKTFYWLNDENKFSHEIGATELSFFTNSEYSDRLKNDPSDTETLLEIDDIELSVFENEKYLNYLKNNPSDIEQDLEPFDVGGTKGAVYPNNEFAYYFYALDKDNTIVVIEFMDSTKEPGKNVNHILAHKAWVQENLAAEGQKARGIMLCNKKIERFHLITKAGFRGIELKMYPLITKIEKQKQKVKYAGNAEFLPVNEWHKAIKPGIAKKDEKYLRKYLWWAFNDRIRNKEKLFVDDNDEALYTSNCIRLIKLLDKNITEEKIMIAEIYRNIENYDQCINTLKEVTDERFEEIIELIRTECGKRNRYVIETGWWFCTFLWPFIGKR